MIKTFFVVGPTASGKTEYAVRFAEDIGGEIVSADSMQIYKYMDIGSGEAGKRRYRIERVSFLNFLKSRINRI